uniref:Sepiapterin reductase a n=1 Tax=Tetraodon nigroviridis TaxID=99883 RepID=H3DQZ5_TETNG
GLVVRCVVADLAEPEAPGRVVEACQQVFADSMEHVLLVNNAASLGDVSRYTRTFTTRAEVDSYMSLNISSCLCLTACVLQAFPQRPGVQRTVVNVSSLCAQQPFSSWVLYCTAKAARDMMFRVLAAEEPELRVLSYAPGSGPLDTDMFSAARATTADPGLRRTFSDMSAQGRVLTPEQSCSKLMELLLEDTYQSGAHVDFYD